MNKLRTLVVILSLITFITGAYLILTVDNVKCSAKKLTEIWNQVHVLLC